MMQTPLFDVGDQAYLVESAMAGFLEPVTITEIKHDKTGSIYYMWEQSASRPSITATIGDAITVVPSSCSISVRESDLVSYAVALSTIIANLEQQLTYFRSLQSNQ